MLPAVAKMLFRLPDAAGVIDNPDPEELQAAHGEDAERAPDALRQPQRPDGRS